MKTAFNWSGTQNRSFFVKTLVCITLAVVLGFTMAACGDDPGGGGGVPQQLAKPLNLQIDGTNLTWGAVANASGYSVQIDNEEPVDNGTSTTYSLESLGYGTYSLKVKALGNGSDYSDSEWSDPKTYEKQNMSLPQLPAPTGVQANTSTKNLTWNTVTGAVSYLVGIDNAEYQVSTNSYPLAGLTTAKTYSIKVKAIGNNTTNRNSEWTTAVSYTVTAPPTAGNGSFTSISNKDVYLDEGYWDSENDVWVYDYKKVTNNSYDGDYTFVEEWDDSLSEWSIIPLSTYINNPTAGLITVQITNGKLTVNLGTPKAEALESVAERFEDLSYVTISNQDAKMFRITRFTKQDGKFLNYEGDAHAIGLVYVNSDVTISGTDSGTSSYEDPYEETYALDLRTGWNYVKESWYENNGIDYYSRQTTQPGDDSMWIVSEPKDTPPPGNGSFNFPISNKDVYLDEGYWDDVNDVRVYDYKKVTNNSYDGDYTFVYDGWDDDTDQEIYTPLSTYIDNPIEVQITSGKLTVNLGTPKADALESVTEVLGDFPDITISNQNAKMLMVPYFFDQGENYQLYYGGDDYDILFIYVNSDVTVTGTETYEYEEDEYTVTFELDLRQGWNYVKNAWSYDDSNGWESYQTTQPGDDSKWVVSGPWWDDGGSGGGDSGGAGYSYMPPSRSVSPVSEDKSAPERVRGSFFKRIRR